MRVSNYVPMYIKDKWLVDTPHKRYVTVRADFCPDGTVQPIKFKLINDPEPHVFQVDQILDIRPAAATKAGGHGVRYMCRCEDQVFALYYTTLIGRDMGSYWFIEV